MIVLDTIPAVSVCGGVEKASWLAAAGLTVSCCVAEATPPAAVTVIVGDPAAVSVYLKLTVLAPAAMVSGDEGANVPLLDVVLRVTVRALPASTGLPNESTNATVIVPEETPAVSVCGDVVKVKWLAAAATTVSFCVADASDPAAAVSVGVPADVSVYRKLAVAAPAGIVSGEDGVKLPVLELLDKLTVKRAARVDWVPQRIFESDGDRAGSDSGGERSVARW